METRDQATVEMLALAVLRNAVRGRSIDGDAVTYRRALPGIVPGQRLTIAVEKRWRFRKTEMIGGALLHAGFSLRALRLAGFELPRLTARGLVGPADGDSRLREGLLAQEAGEWALARCLLLDVLEDQPACLPAQAALGRLLGELEHRDTALAHLTAAIRLGLGALAGVEATPVLDATRESERFLLGALVTRATLLDAMGRPEDAVSDLRRALAWDPSDSLGAGRQLARLEHLLRPLPGLASGGRS